MNIKIFFLIILLHCRTSLMLVHKEQSDWINILTKLIIKQIKPYQITFFLSKFSKYYGEVEKCTLIKRLNEKSLMPVVTMNNIDCYKDSSFSSLLFLKYVSLNVIFDTPDCKFTKLVLDACSRISPKNIRPQVLIVMFHVKFIQKSKIQQILQYAWKKNFLDISILTVSKVNDEIYKNEVFYFWNPFHQYLSISTFDSTIIIFPNKILTSNGYPLKLPTANFPPFLEVEKDKNKITRVTGLYYPFLEFILKTMNFTIQFGFDIDFYSDHSIDYFINTRLKNGDENMMSVTYPIHLLDVAVSVEIDYIYRELVAIVPIIPTTKFNIPKDILLYAFIIPMLIICFLRLLQFFKIISPRWEAFRVIQLLLGVTVHMKFKALDINVIYSSLIVLSLAYTNKLYSSILNIKLDRSEMPLRTLQEIDESGLPIFIDRIHFERFYEINSTKKHMGSMMRRTHKVDNITECIRSIVRSENVICITTNWHASYFVKEFKAAERRIFKVNKLPVIADKVGYIFEPASPFAESFDKVQRKVLESGIWFKITSDDLAVYKQKEYDTSDDKFSVIKLVPIAIFGYFVSFTTFLIEYFIDNKIKKTL